MNPMSTSPTMPKTEAGALHDLASHPAIRPTSKMTMRGV